MSRALISGLLLGLLVLAGWGEAPPQVQKDLVYGQVAGRDLHLDFYPAPRSGKAPLLIFVHGGGWSGGTKNRLGLGAGELLRAGFSLASVEYRLVPEAVWPAQLEDVKCAVRYLRCHADQLGVDGQRFGAWGESAGGHLVALLALAGPEAGYDRSGGYPGVSSSVQAAADLYGPTDLTAGDATTSQGEHYVKDFLAGRMELEREASPAAYVNSKAPPFLILHGDEDQLVPFHQSQVLTERLQAAGVKVQLVTVHHAGHDLKPSNGTPDPDPRVLAAMLVEFFRSNLIAK